ncbi:MAG TPA: hypothetical protein VHX38_29465 [Pseudonocardiaceae bacterium]|nr:hypothetical protein [Pseudonocardiaceae bacterium]
MAVVGVALVFSDVAFLAPVLLLLAILVVVLDSWLHRPGRLIDPKAANAALRRDKEGREGGGSEVRRPSRQTGAQSAVRSSTGSRGQSGRPRQQGGQYTQSGSRQQPRARQQAPDYRERERGRSRY